MVRKQFVWNKISSDLIYFFLFPYLGDVSKSPYEKKSEVFSISQTRIEMACSRSPEKNFLRFHYDYLKSQVIQIIF